MAYKKTKTRLIPKALYSTFTDEQKKVLSSVKRAIAKKRPKTVVLSKSSISSLARAIKTRSFKRKKRY